MRSVRTEQSEAEHPGQVWLVLWGLPDADEDVAMILSADAYTTRSEAEAKVDEFIDEWAEQLWSRGGWGDMDFRTWASHIEVFGPVEDSFSNVVAGLSAPQVLDILNALRVHGWAYLPVS